LGDAIISLMNDPKGQWIVSVILSILLGPVVFLIVRFLWSLPAAKQRTVLKIILVVIFFPLIFLFLACTVDPDD
jgi:phosphoglycerol transferase MdoB-like AlkP superfamily enzyme